MLPSNFWLKGLVGPRGFSSDGTEVSARFEKNGALVVTQGRGKWAELCSRGKVFQASVAAVTIPVIANNLVSVFGLYNPAGSGIDMEIIDTEVTAAVATTVVDQFVWAIDLTAAKSLAATFTTLGAPKCRRMTESPANQGRFYSAVTHSGTPETYAPIGQDGATTSPGGGGRRREYDGSLILPPGFLMSVAATVAAGTATGLNIQATWAEIPIQ